MSKFSNIWVWAGELMDSGYAPPDAMRVVSGSLLSDPRFVPLTSITVADSPYTVTEDDIYIDADASGGSITVNLPAGIEGRIYNVKNSSGSGSNTVTVVPDGTETVDGAASAILQPTPTRESITIVYKESATDWRIV